MRLRSTLILFIGLFCHTAISAQNTVAAIAIRCHLSASGYAGFEDFFIVESVVLKGPKQGPRGAKRVFVKPPYEFWAMTHTLQISSDKTVVNNFQLAVRNSKTGEFVHALSNSAAGKAGQPLSARISLVEYTAGTMLEQGELLFQCRSQEG